MNSKNTKITIEENEECQNVNGANASTHVAWYDRHFNSMRSIISSKLCVAYIKCQFISTQLNFTNILRDFFLSKKKTTKKQRKYLKKSIN